MPDIIPDIYIDEDGDFRLEWYWGIRRIVSLSINKIGEINYAGIFDEEIFHGKTALDENGLPENIKHYIRNIIGDWDD